MTIISKYMCIYIYIYMYICIIRHTANQRYAVWTDAPEHLNVDAHVAGRACSALRPISLLLFALSYLLLFVFYYV